MSNPELSAACLAAYNPDVFEIQEQRMLFTTEIEHPLTGLFPDRINKHPNFRGTVEVADSLGYLDLHPTIRCKIDGKTKTVPWPFQGDLLLFIDQGTGAYCVNWPVKDRREEFLGPSDPVTDKEKREQRKKIARHEIELAYYLDANIRSVAIAGEEIDENVAHNLLRLCCYAVRQNTLPASQIDDVELALVAALQAGYPAGAVIARLGSKGRLTEEQGRVVFHQAIWHRRLRVDLFRPILIDRPMVPETTDVLSYYSSWFAK